MKLNFLRMVPYATIGSIAQYVWLSGIPSSSRHASGVAIITGISSILINMLWARLGRGGMGVSPWFTLPSSTLAGAVISTLAIWTLDFLNRAELFSIQVVIMDLGVLNVAFAAFIAGGWFVGGLCGVGYFIMMRRV